MNNDRPIYIQIVEDFKKSIVIDKYKIGDKIPSVREIASTYKANPNTCMKALQILEEIGLITTISTSGKFVTNDISIIDRLKSEMKNLFLKNILCEANELKIDYIELSNAIKKGEW